MTKRIKSEMTNQHNYQTRSVHTLEVFLFSGPISEEYIKQNPVVSRTIQIRGDQTLAELHTAIFQAFDREEEHHYEFQFGGKGPMDPQAQRYGLQEKIKTKSRRPSPSPVQSVTLNSLNLHPGEVFGYWFDFGDDWWHQINVISIEDGIVQDSLPKIIKRIGQSPPQYSEDFE